MKGKVACGGTAVANRRTAIKYIIVASCGN